MRLSNDDLAKLDLISRFLKQGTFTLKGVDVTTFVECRFWLQEFMKPKPEVKEDLPKPKKKKKVK